MTDVMHSCCCCLRCPPDKDLTTPYTHLGSTEIYSDMLKECFDLHLPVGGGSCGICSSCVGRLRDASDFKLQVQRSQAELRARLQGALLVGDEEQIWKLEHEDETIQGALYEDPLLKSEPADDMASDEFSPASAGLEPRDNTAGLRAEEAYTCDTCGKHFTGKSTLIAHVRRHRARDEAAATYSCGTCSEQFFCKYLFARHTHAHTAQETYVCDMCNKQFRAKSILIEHIQTHMKLKLYSCGVCSETFKYICRLKRHEVIHTGEKPYMCDECKKQFPQRGSLNRHKKIHTREKPFRCEVCKKQFTQKNNLVRHKKIHSEEKPFRCEVCKKQFTKIKYLCRHSQVKSKYSLFK